MPLSTGLERPIAGKQRYLQTLALSYLAPRTHVAITTTNAPSQTQAGTPASSIVSTSEAVSGEPATLISIPSGMESEDFNQLITSKFSPSWQQRQVLEVPRGYAFEIGEFTVRVGELRQQGGGGAHGRGTVAEVQWDGGGEEGEEDWESAEDVIGSFWDGLGIKGARKVFSVPGLELGEGLERQWCEILRLRT